MTANGSALVVVGAGGHGKAVADVAITAGWQVLGFVDEAAVESPLPSLPLLGDLTALAELRGKESLALVIGIGDNPVRRRLAEGLAEAGHKFATVIAPSAVVSAYASLGAGTVVMPRAVVNVGAGIGEHVILNTACVVDHDCRVGDFAHVSPGALLAGNVRVGQGTHVGTGVSVVPGCTIGEWSTVGAGATVTRDIGAFVVAVGVPAVERPKRLSQV